MPVGEMGRHGDEHALTLLFEFGALNGLAMLPSILVGAAFVGAKLSQHGGVGEGSHAIFRLAQRATAAVLAISARLALLSFLARAMPPIRPSADSAAFTDASFVVSAFIGS